MHIPWRRLKHRQLSDEGDVWIISDWGGPLHALSDICPALVAASLPPESLQSGMNFLYHAIEMALVSLSPLTGLFLKGEGATTQKTSKQLPMYTETFLIWILLFVSPQEFTDTAFNHLLSSITVEEVTFQKWLNLFIERYDCVIMIFHIRLCCSITFCP